MGAQGCQGPGGAGKPDRAPPPSEVAVMQTEPEITEVRVYHPSYPAWQWTEDKQAIRGIKVGPVYLVGPNGKGVFGDGVIRPRLYRLDRHADHKVVPTLLKEWAFTVEEAVPWRIKKPSLMGWAYGLPLVWEDPGLLAGAREVRLVIAFECSDGRLVSSSKKDVQVPRGAS